MSEAQRIEPRVVSPNRRPLRDPAMSQLDEWCPVGPHGAAAREPLDTPVDRRRRFVVLPGGRTNAGPMRTERITRREERADRERS